MQPAEVQNEIAIIKAMIAKTRRETAESGLIYITLGILWVLVTVAVGVFELTALYQAIWPTTIAGAVLTVMVAVLIAYRESHKERVKSYSRVLFAQLWIACAIPAILVAFLFPLTGIYSPHLIPPLVTAVLGIAFYMTGVIYESRLIQICAFSWWIGAVVMAYTTGPVKFAMMTLIMLVGYILPGIILHREYVKLSARDEA